MASVAQLPSHFRFACMFAVSLVAVFGVVDSRAVSPAATTEVTPSYLETTLQSSIDAGHAKAGEAFYLKAMDDWSGLNCVLRKGATLQGHVVGAQKVVGHTGDSQLTLTIDSADCDGQRHKLLLLTIVEIVGDDSASEEHLHSVVPQEIRGGGRNIGGATNDISTDYKTSGPRGPFMIHPGQVLGLKDVVLHLGTGQDRSVLITRKEHNIRLTQNSEIVLSTQDQSQVDVKPKLP